MFCGKCGNENPDNNKFCKHCGFKLANGFMNSSSNLEEDADLTMDIELDSNSDLDLDPNMIPYSQPALNICEKCGNENVEHAVFCKYCGSKLSIDRMNSNSNPNIQMQSGSYVSSRSQTSYRSHTYNPKKETTELPEGDFGNMTEEERYDYLYKKMNNINSESKTYKKEAELTEIQYADFVDDARDVKKNAEDSLNTQVQVSHDDYSEWNNYGKRLRTDRGVLVDLLLPGIIYSLLTGYCIYKIFSDLNPEIYGVFAGLLFCGSFIYGFYYVHKLSEDVNIACDGDGDHTSGALIFFLLSFITCGIYAYIWQYKLGNRLHVNAQIYGFNIAEDGSHILLWAIVGIFICFIGPIIAVSILLKNTNLICKAYNRENGF